MQFNTIQFKRSTDLNLCFKSLSLSSLIAVLSACGGGSSSGGDSSGVEPPVNEANFSMANCDAKPIGVLNTYLNSSSARREWVNATFDGTNVIARKDYNSAGALLEIHYYIDNTSTNTSTLVGREWFGTNGALTRQIRFNRHTRTLTLTPGQTQMVNYTWEVLIPNGEAGGNGNLTESFEGVEIINLPEGRTQACKFNRTTSSNGNVTESETYYTVPGINYVKSYARINDPLATNNKRIVLTELATTTSTALTYSTPIANATPSLASCSAMPLGLDMFFTASTANEIQSGRRTSFAASLQGINTIGLQRRHITTNAPQLVQHFDMNIGFLGILGRNDGATFGTVFRGRPDLRTTTVNNSVTFTETSTPFPSGSASSDSIRFTNLGHEKITTLAGTTDTCKVQFLYGNSGLIETYWLEPNSYWVRLETLSSSGIRTSREIISR